MRRSIAVLVVLAAVASLGSCWLFGPSGTVEGVVLNATSGDPVAGVKVSAEGVSLANATTDADGEFSIELPAGPQVLEFLLNGYDIPPLPVTVVAGETTELPAGTIVASPQIAGSGIRFILTWGALPYDLDSHLLTPSGHHVYYNDEAPVGAGASLDRDDRDSYGPETITITDLQAGTYKYYVYNWSGSPEIATSGAVVRVYNSGGLWRTITIPTGGTGLYWNVATLNGTTLTVINQIQASEP